MEDAAAEHRPSPSTAQISRWLGIGLATGLVGVLFLGIICGPITIYFGLRARNAAAAIDARGDKTKAALIIALGAFDMLFFLIRIVGTIRLIGTGA